MCIHHTLWNAIEVAHCKELKQTNFQVPEKQYKWLFVVIKMGKALNSSIHVNKSVEYTLSVSFALH